MSIADDIRKKVSEHLENATELETTVSNLYNTDAKKRSLDCFIAVITVIDAQLNNKTLSEDDYRNYAGAVAIAAKLKDIKKDSANNSISKKDLTEQLNSGELLRMFSANYLRENNSLRKESQKDLDTELKKLFPDNPDGSSTIPPQIKEASNVMSYKTDEEFKKLSEEDKKTYLQQNFLSNYEKDRLQKLISDKNNNTLDEELSGEFKQETEDKDFLHRQKDDDFKIEQGDIIDYMMKSLILPSIAWVGNKSAGFLGTVVYETASKVYRNASPYIKEKLSQIRSSYEKTKENLFKKDDPIDKQKEEIFDNILASFTNNISVLDEAIEKYEKFDTNDFSVFRNLQKLVAKHHVIIGNEGVTIYDEKNGDKNKFEEQNYSNLLHTKNQDCQNFFIKFQKSVDEFKINEIAERLNIPADSVKSWYTKYHSQLDTCINNHEVDDLTQPRYVNERIQFLPQDSSGVTISDDTMIQELNHAQEFAELNIDASAKKRVIEAQCEKFAELYAKFKSFEIYRLDFDNPILHDPQQLTTEIQKQKEIAKIIFYKNEQKRREGLDVLSREELIDTASKLVDQSKNAIDNDSKDSYGNPIEIKDTIGNNPNTYVNPANTQEQQSILDAAQESQTIETLLKSELNNIDGTIDFLEKNKEENSKKLNICKKLKTEMLEKAVEQGFMDESKGYNDPSKNVFTDKSRDTRILPNRYFDEKEFQK